MIGPQRRRVLVVGGSSGIGRSLAVALGCRGDAVAVAARRAGPLGDAAAEAGPDAVPLVCDVADEDQCLRLVHEAAEALGGLDQVVYATGTSPLGRLDATTARDWSAVFATNVIGAATVVSAAREHLHRAPGPTAVLLSSHSVGRPWPGLVPYASSKAALDELALGLRAEEPWLRVVRVVVGPTATPFADGWDPVVAGPLFDQWTAEGRLDHQVLEPSEVAARILEALDDPRGPDDLRVVGAPDPG